MFCNIFRAQSIAEFGSSLRRKTCYCPKDLAVGVAEKEVNTVRKEMSRNNNERFISK